MGDLLVFAAVIFFIRFIIEVQCRPPCSKDYYFDEITRNCDPCSEICDFKEVKGTQGSCDKHCPDYQEPCQCDQTKRRRRSNRNCEKECLKSANDHHQDNESNLNKKEVAIVVSIAAVVISVVGVVAVVVYRRSHPPSGYTAANVSPAAERPQAPEPEPRDCFQGPPPEASAESPEVRRSSIQEPDIHRCFRYIDDPVHAQATCTDDTMPNPYASERRHLTEEENNSPTAFPELPSNALNTLHISEDL